MKLNLLVPLFCFVGFIACTTPSERPTSPGSPTTPGGHANQNWDVQAIEHELAMDRPAQVLGYAERVFNSCEFATTDKYGPCGNRYFVQIHFRLQCRDSEGTISQTDYQTHAITDDKVAWTLAGNRGTVATDEDGYGQLRMIGAYSAHELKVRLTTNGRFLVQTAGEMDRIVAPGTWCTRRKR